jgi:hypothetical protein
MQHIWAKKLFVVLTENLYKQQETQNMTWAFLHQTFMHGVIGCILTTKVS